MSLHTQPLEFSEPKLTDTKPVTSSTDMEPKIYENNTPNEIPEIYYKHISFKDTLPLRRTVFTKAPRIQYPFDAEGIHIGAFLKSPATPNSSNPNKPNDNDSPTHTPIAVISLFHEDISEFETLVPLSNNNDRHCIRIRKFACHPTFQNKGIGTRLFEYAMSVARNEMDGTMLWCQAVPPSNIWYAKRGFEALSGLLYTGAGIEFIIMKRELS
ncbi:hypothetical protein D9756_002918 [Leucocoprinus leucothites]|uniref:N-acetyltransferase domain-containing protein n=1 Tax=Leucocoprinus leucothites TaxID=201217 RepID=A0A8H5LJG4_9AGAR|nr:hypothetical protein D9756_002918 [Leucoagaricus leucothites]